jgi:hypothetical protein
MGNLSAHTSLSAERLLVLAREQETLCRQSGDRRGVAKVLNNLGTLYLSLQQEGQAVPCLEEALQLSNALGDSAGQFDLLAKLRTACAGLHRSEQATEFAELLRQKIHDRMAKTTKRASLVEQAFRALLDGGITDPDVRMFAAIITGDTNGMVEALAGGANPSRSPALVLRRYAEMCRRSSGHEKWAAAVLSALAS